MEFALIAPVLVMLVVGTITTGVSYSQALGITNAVREGARFGAIADASAATWANDVIARTHTTQFDDPSTETTICVEIWKATSPTVYPATPVKSGCNTPAGPGIVAADYNRFPLPSVPANVCVVRVVAARNYTISAPPLLPAIPRKMVRGSVARYERTTC